MQKPWRVSVCQWLVRTMAPAIIKQYFTCGSIVKMTKSSSEGLVGLPVPREQLQQSEQHAGLRAYSGSGCMLCSHRTDVWAPARHAVDIQQGCSPGPCSSDINMCSSYHICSSKAAGANELVVGYLLSLFLLELWHQQMFQAFPGILGHRQHGCAKRGRQHAGNAVPHQCVACLR